MFFGQTMLHPNLRRHQRQSEPLPFGYKIADLSKDLGDPSHPSQQADISRRIRGNDCSDAEKNCGAGKPRHYICFGDGTAVSALDHISTQSQFEGLELQLNLPSQAVNFLNAFSRCLCGAQVRRVEIPLRLCRFTASKWSAFFLFPYGPDAPSISLGGV